MARKNFSPKVEESQRVYKNVPDASVPFESCFTGDIETKAGVRIDGSVKGNVTAAGNVTIGSDGSVEGTVTGKDINIAGSITGNVNSYGTVQMLCGAKLAGDMQASSIAIEQGAYYKGKCTITDKRAENAKDCLESVDEKKPKLIVPAKESKPKTADSQK